MIGSRTANIVGSKYKLDSFDRKLYDAKDYGMTRIEVSICHGAFKRFSPQFSSIRTNWHLKIQAAMDYLVSEILNDQDTIKMAYRQMSVPKLLALFGRAKENLLLIGSHNCWLINAKTFLPRRFVGTRLAAGMTRLANSEVTWKRLNEFVKRYAAPNATVKVFCLHEHVSLSDYAAIFHKCKDAAFQLPGCGMANQNGIKLPSWIQMPID